MFVQKTHTHKKKVIKKERIAKLVNNPGLDNDSFTC